MTIRGEIELEVSGVRTVVRFELHDPIDVGPLVAGVIGTVIAEGGREEEFGGTEPLARNIVLPAAISGYVAAQASARKYERARRRATGPVGGRSRRGKPGAIGFSRAEAFAVMARYYEERLGCKQPVKAVQQHWMRTGTRVTPSLPSPRHIKEARAAVRSWIIPDLEAAAEGMQRSLGLGPLPTVAAYMRHIRRPNRSRVAN